MTGHAGDDTATETLLERRARLLGPNVPTFYDTPVHIVRGEGVWLWDKAGRKYLDGYNNVPHVGHGHPRVVAAIAEQAAQLNTHTRYLHEGILDYTEALTARLDASLSAMILTCTGSEANDVAMRMAMAASGNTGFIATDHTYHGNTALVSQLSTRRPPIGGRADNIRLVATPDSLRAGADMPLPDAFGASVERAVAELRESGHGVAALVVCPFMANEGFPTLPPGFFDRAIAAVRGAGGVVIADEVQPGFGRLGSHWWGHERARFLPEIITLGKPMGNGFPVAGVVAGAEMMGAFRNAFGYFNTFGGNPVACAAASAVLEVIEDEGLIENAADTGAFLQGGLNELARRYPVIGDVRGAGLFLGAELVRDDALTPDPDLTHRVVEGMKARGILLNRIGIHDNVLKIRPPLAFGRAHAERMLDSLDSVLAEQRPSPAT